MTSTWQANMSGNIDINRRKEAIVRWLYSNLLGGAFQDQLHKQKLLFPLPPASCYSIGDGGLEAVGNQD
jgi:hypothetical protein